jgi:hypothetical protein
VPRSDPHAQRMRIGSGSEAINPVGVSECQEVLAANLSTDIGGSI